MWILLFLGVAMAMASTSPPPDMECIRPGRQGAQSTVSVLLQIAGYKDTCVAAALNSCSSGTEEPQSPSLAEDINERVNKLEARFNISEFRPRHCKDLLDSGDGESGLREVFPVPERPYHQITVFCNHVVDGGGWTVFQRRTPDTVVRQNFRLNWEQYRQGFGDIEGEEFWLGNRNLHDLTSTSPQELRIDLEDYEGGQRWAKYDFFQVGAQQTNYALTVGRYSGNAGNSMAYHDGQQFTTYDANHDKANPCPIKLRGGWWHRGCGNANLNGYRYEGNYTLPAMQGIIWDTWRGNEYSLKRTSMMIRPAP